MSGTAEEKIAWAIQDWPSGKIDRVDVMDELLAYNGRWRMDHITGDWHVKYTRRSMRRNPIEADEYEMQSLSRASHPREGYRSFHMLDRLFAKPIQRVPDDTDDGWVNVCIEYCRLVVVRADVRDGRQVMPCRWDSTTEWECTDEAAARVYAQRLNVEICTEVLVDLQRRFPDASEWSKPMPLLVPVAWPEPEHGLGVIEAVRDRIRNHAAKLHEAQGA